MLTGLPQRLGGCEKINPDKAIESAVKLAAASDVTIVVVGLSPEWESEGFDRPTLDMPGRQNELVRRVGQANPNTVVCVQAVSICLLSEFHHSHCIRGLLFPCPG